MLSPIVAARQQPLQDSKSRRNSPARPVCHVFKVKNVLQAHGALYCNMLCPTITIPDALSLTDLVGSTPFANFECARQI